MTSDVFDMPEIPRIPLTDGTGQIPVRRVFCVGRNYVAHAAEMGGSVDREAPWYFTKSVFHVVPGGSRQPYPPGTENYHYEMELAFAIGTPVFRASVEAATNAIFAYGCGLDMTRRDRQQDGKDHRRPWDLGKDVEGSAVLAPMTRAADMGPIRDQRIQLSVNGDLRQDARLSDMVWSCEDIVRHLSGYYHLGPGDIVLTGTPAGVGPVVAGDEISGTITGLAPVTLTLETPE